MRTLSKSSSQSSCTSQPKIYNTATPSIILTSPAASRQQVFPRTPSNNSNSNGTISLDRTTKCATVTMMLAERIIRNDWSVEDEHFFESNNMNVWQTLEFLSDVNSRKHYNYEGYSDANNTMRTLAPSWRRDSFIEKNVNPNSDESNAVANGKYPTVTNSIPDENDNSVLFNNPGVNGNGLQKSKIIHTTGSEKSSKFAKDAQRLAKNIHEEDDLDSEYALSPLDYSDLIKCTFNLPRISAALERLMGTNVVRLTDRNYMKELRERIEADYRVNLQKRITARELKEIERERVLVIEGKTSVIPAELAEDPIFVVGKKAHVEISNTRMKLKTNREKNSDRLKLQGVKWERERLQHEEEEAERLNILRERHREQKDLEEQYQNEDTYKGMDLLRIENEGWRPCEEQLREFLEQERSKMKERSLRDPKDVNNILKARKEFRELERLMRKDIEDKHKLEKSQQKCMSQQKSVQQDTGSFEFLGSSKSMQQSGLTESQTTKDFYEAYDLEVSRLQNNPSSDSDSVTSSGESLNEDSLIKPHYADELEQQIENDIAEGHIALKEKYDHFRYEDSKILQLRNAKDIRELYQLAEEIIIGAEYCGVQDEEEDIVAENEDIEGTKINMQIPS